MYYWGKILLITKYLVLVKDTYSIQVKSYEWWNTGLLCKIHDTFHEFLLNLKISSSTAIF